MTRTPRVPLGLVAGLLLVASACGGARPPARPPMPESKMDAPLRLALVEAADTARVACLVELRAPPAPGDTASLAAAGLHVQAATGSIHAADGTPAAIRRAAALPAVVRIELARTRSAR